MIRFVFVVLSCTSVVLSANDVRGQVEPFLERPRDRSMFSFCANSANARKAGLNDEEIKRVEELYEIVNSPMRDLTAGDESSVEAAIAARDALAVELLPELKEIYGPDRIARAIQLLNRQTLYHKAYRAKINDPTYLLTEMLNDKLDMSDHQKSVIMAIHEKFIEDLNADSKTSAGEFEEVDKTYLQDIYNVLDEKQRQQHENVYGQPLNLKTFLDAETRRHFNYDGDGWGRSGYDSKRKGDADEENPVNYVWVDTIEFIMNREEFQQDLGLIQDQVKKFESYYESLNPHAESDHKTFKKRMTELLNGKVQTTKGLQEILNDEQELRIVRLETQLRLAKFRTSFGLLSNIVRDHIALTDEQAERIETMIPVFEMKVEETAKQQYARREKIYEQYIEKALGALSPSQRVDYDYLLGTDEIVVK